MSPEHVLPSRLMVGRSMEARPAVNLPIAELVALMLRLPAVQSALSPLPRPSLQVTHGRGWQGRTESAAVRKNPQARTNLVLVLQ